MLNQSLNGWVLEKCHPLAWVRARRPLRNVEFHIKRLDENLSKHDPARHIVYQSVI